MQHNAPDNSPVTNVIHLHLLSKFEAKLETCSPNQGNCQPNIKELALTGTAGVQKTVTLFHQASMESYWSECEGALFDLTGAPFWLSLKYSSYLVIAPPNDINVLGKYQFSIGRWDVTLEIDAPCRTRNLEGLEE